MNKEFVSMRYFTSVPAIVFWAASLLVGAAFAGAVRAADSYPGWESDSAYGKMYDVSEYDKIKGGFVEIIDVTPFPGMAPGVGMVIRDRADGETIIVHVAPKAFALDKLEALNLRPGQKIKVYGAWVDIDGADVLLATKIKKTENEFIKVRRTKDGYPFWSMTPEELKKELLEP